MKQYEADGEEGKRKEKRRGTNGEGDVVRENSTVSWQRVEGNGPERTSVWFGCIVDGGGSRAGTYGVHSWDTRITMDMGMDEEEKETPPVRGQTVPNGVRSTARYLSSISRAPIRSTARGRLGLERQRPPSPSPVLPVRSAVSIPSRLKYVVNVRPLVATGTLKCLTSLPIGRL